MRMVFIDNLKAGMIMDRDVFDLAGGMIPLVKQNTRLTNAMISELVERGIKFVYIGDGTKPAIDSQSGNRIVRPIAVPKPKAIIRPTLQKDAVESLEKMFSTFPIDVADFQASSAHIIKHLDSVVEQLVDSLQVESKAMVNINDLKSHDEYTFHHSLSVAVLTIAIAQHLGFSSADLKRIGMCAMMHDIGKMAVPIEIINKPGRLDAEEFRIIQTHSPAGYDYLVKTSLRDEDILRGVLQHHEKYSGGGYPNGVKGEEIHSWARIISVADVYDALTSNRPYRTPMQPAEAIEFIMGGVGSSFDYDMVTAFIEKVELYPVASMVELSNGRIAQVISSAHSMRPVVRMQDTGEVFDLFTDRACLSLIIVRVIERNDQSA